MLFELVHWFGGGSGLVVSEAVIFATATYIGQELACECCKASSMFTSSDLGTGHL